MRTGRTQRPVRRRTAGASDRPAIFADTAARSVRQRTSDVRHFSANQTPRRFPARLHSGRPCGARLLSGRKNPLHDRAIRNLSRAYPQGCGGILWIAGKNTDLAPASFPLAGYAPFGKANRPIAVFLQRHAESSIFTVARRLPKFIHGACSRNDRQPSISGRPPTGTPGNKMTDNGDSDGPARTSDRWQATRRRARS